MKRVNAKKRSKTAKILAFLVSFALCILPVQTVALAEEADPGYDYEADVYIAEADPEDDTEEEASDEPETEQAEEDEDTDAAEEGDEQETETAAQAQDFVSGTFLDFFPDPVFAQAVADKFERNKTDLVTTEELEIVVSLYCYSSAYQNIYDITGVSYMKNLTTLDVSSQKISVIPDEIAELAKLESLSLTGNQISEVPDCLALLTNLTALSLDGNNLDHFPEVILELTDLDILGLSQNSLQEIPDNIGDLSKLRMLNLSYTGISELPDSFFNLSNLHRLSLNRNHLSEIPDGIGNLVNLKNLELRVNEIVGVSDQISKLTNLEDLYLDYNQISELPDVFDSMNSLSAIWLRNNKLIDLPDSFAYLERVGSLDLTYNELTSIPYGVAMMPNLRTLSVDYNNLFKLGSHCSTMPLERLYVSNNQIIEFPMELLSMPNLIEVNLGRNPIHTIPEEASQIKDVYIFISDVCLISRLPDFLLEEEHRWQFYTQNSWIEDLYIPENFSQWSLDMFLPPIVFQSWEYNETQGRWTVGPATGGYEYIDFVDGTELYEKLLEPGKYIVQFNYAWYSPIEIIDCYYYRYVIVGDIPPVGDTFLDYFPDAALAQAVAESVGKVSSDATTAAELAGITTLNASSRGVASLVGIGNLTGLTSLNASYNNITTVPAEIGDLTGITNLDLRSNQITSLPVEIGNLASLAHLYLNVNTLEALPQELDGIATLRTLYAQNNAITEALPEICYTLAGSRAYFQRQTATLPALTVGDGTSITSDLLLPGFVRQLQAKNGGQLVGKWTVSGPGGTQTVAAGTGSEITPALFTQEGVYTVVYSTDGGSYAINDLSISALEYTVQVTVGGSVQPGNTFADYFPDGILAQAVAETVGKNSTDDTTPPELAGITDLNVVGKGVQDLAGIGNLTGLHELRVSSNPLGSLPAEIGNLQSLRVLGAASCNLTSLPNELWNLGSLQTLAVDSNPLGGLPQEISNLTSLTALYANAIGLTEELPTAVFSLSNAVLSDQTAALPGITVTLGVPVSSSQLLPPVVEQLAGYNGGNLVGAWTITGPDGIPQTIPAGDGSEISSAVFPVAGQYTVQYATGSSFYSTGNVAVGRLTYTTTVTVS